MRKLSRPWTEEDTALLKRLAASGASAMPGISRAEEKQGKPHGQSARTRDSVHDPAGPKEDATGSGNFLRYWSVLMAPVTKSSTGNLRNWLAACHL
jgi:hypothetical protein